MTNERKEIIDAAARAGKKARARAKKCQYEFVKMEDGCLYKIINGQKKLIKKITQYSKLKEAILKDKRLGW